MTKTGIATLLLIKYLAFTCATSSEQPSWNDIQPVTSSSNQTENTVWKICDGKSCSVLKCDEHILMHVHILGPSSTPLEIDSVVINPDPPVKGDNITIEATFTLSNL